MSKNLVIVESPAKAKTIQKYLGKDFEVLASYGHVRDLVPKDGAVDVTRDHEYTDWADVEAFIMDPDAPLPSGAPIIPGAPTRSNL